MNRIQLLREDIAGVQAFLDEFGSCSNREARSASLNRTGEFVIVRNFPLPDAFRPDHVDVLLVVADYPGQPPTGLHILNGANANVVSHLKRIFNVFANDAFHGAPAIQGYSWICYHYASGWRYNARRPAEGDNLRKFLLSFYTACERG
jgi:hypothetical protein